MLWCLHFDIVKPRHFEKYTLDISCDEEYLISVYQVCNNELMKLQTFDMLVTGTLFIIVVK